MNHQMYLIYSIADLSHYSPVLGRKPVFQTCSCFIKGILKEIKLCQNGMNEGVLHPLNSTKIVDIKKCFKGLQHKTVSEQS